MIGKNNRSLPIAIQAVGKLGSQKNLDQLLPFLQRPEKEVRVAAIGAVAHLAGEQQAEAVRPHLQQSAQGADETVSRAVAKALQKLDGRLSPSGRFTGTGTLGATVAGSMTPTPMPTPTPTQARATTTRAAAPPLPPSTSATSTARTLLVEGPEGTVAAPPPEAPSFDLTALQTGDMIEGRYKFIQKIGKGAFGTVVLVEDTVVEERLILKFLNANVSSDEEMLKRFVHELRYSRRITHKNVIRMRSRWNIFRRTRSAPRSRTRNRWRRRRPSRTARTSASA
jgi:serine/threonine-protein kinase